MWPHEEHTGASPISPAIMCPGFDPVTVPAGCHAAADPTPAPTGAVGRWAAVAGARGPESANAAAAVCASISLSLAASISSIWRPASAARPFGGSERSLAERSRRNLDQVVPVQVLDAERSEDVVDDRVRHLDVGVPSTMPRGSNVWNTKSIDELIEGNAVLEALAHRDREAGQDAPQGAALLGQVEEDLPERPIRVLAGA